MPNVFKKTRFIKFGVKNANMATLEVSSFIKAHDILYCFAVLDHSTRHFKVELEEI